MRRLDLRERVKRYMKEHGLPKAGERVIVALSGGADSVCLLYVLAGHMDLRALHVHHGLRGEEADRDEQFVRELCLRMQIPLTVVHCDVKGYARKHRLSEEEAGRKLRYQALDTAARAWEEETAAGPVWIGVAHHQDDHAETIFHHLLRGSGLRGLSGMKPVQGRRIRPLLCVCRKEIVAYLRQEGISWCEDSTNATGDYTRNRIRNEIFPLLTEQINARAVENILHAGEMFAQADEYLERQARSALDELGKLDGKRWKQEVCREQDMRRERDVCRERPEQAQIDLEGFLKLEPVIRSYVLRLMLDAVALGRKDITRRHFNQIERLALLPVGSRCDLPGKLMAWRDYENLWIGTGRQDLEKTMAENLQFCTFSREKGVEIPKNQYTKWFDYDRIKGTLSVRTRQSGDYLTLAGGGHKSLNRYMIDEKIPLGERDTILLLAEGHHILWVVGYRISEYYKITEETQMILQVTKNGGERDGRQNSRIIVGRGSGSQNQ